LDSRLKVDEKAPAEAFNFKDHSIQVNMTKNKTITSSTQDLGHSADALGQRKAELLALIRQTAPEVMADNQINVEKLKELLGQDFIASDEHYELNWAGKSSARREIQKTSSLTLHPDASNPVNAQHMFIEGENLEVLRVLQKSYYGKVKMIYIDPPYNTGNDSFVYPDDYSETLEEYQKRTGEKNEAGYLNKQSLWKKNSKESGQYHSAWLSMMYPRLYLARNLLRDDGMIFISIDDNEASNLKSLCDEIFGSENFVAQFPWRKRTAKSDVPFGVSQDFEWIFCYGKQNALVGTSIERKYYQSDDYPNDRWRLSDLTTQRSADERPNSAFTLVDPKTKKKYSYNPKRVWGVTKDTVDEYLKSGKIVFPDDYDFLRISIPSFRVFESEDKQKALKKYGSEDPMKAVSTLLPKEVGMSENGNEDVVNLFGFKAFSFPKPVALISYLLDVINDKDAIVLDFFAGSGTTAQAVMELNAKDGGGRQFICIQMPETLDLDNESYKAGYRTIADITRARIGKVISKLKVENSEATKELTCALFTLAPSNFKVWRSELDSEAALLEQLSIFQSAEIAAQGMQSNKQTSMLTELLLKNGLGALGVHAISKPRQIGDVTVHRVLMSDDKTMWLCFETYTDSLKEEIVKAMPAQVVMLNSCFVGKKADEQLANLQLELAGLDIGLTVI
jgi:adenine-specific DNA-methyltransferase